MPSLPRRRVLTVLVVLVIAAAVIATVLATRSGSESDVVARDVGIDVIDGPGAPGGSADGDAAAESEQVRIDATLYVPAETPAPAILLAHGFGGSKDSVADEARELADRGFVVLAWSARGFGRTTGQIALNAPDYEVLDARQLVDWLAEQPEVRLDGDRDPRIGVTGASYGGALALSLAATDDRVDAVVPVITWNDLGQALLPDAATDFRPADTPAAGSFGPRSDASADGVFKRSWAGIFFGAGLSGAGEAGPRGEALEEGQEPGDVDSGLGGGAASDGAGTARTSGGAGQGAPAPADLACGRFRPEVCAAYAAVATAGRATPEAAEVLRRASPAAIETVSDAPTMLVQGTQDTLFGLDHADATARRLAAAGATVKVVWFGGGHDGGAPGTRLRGQIQDWFDHHLAGRGDDPGAGFEYAVRGNFQDSGIGGVRVVAADAYPGLGEGSAVERRELAVTGGAQPVFSPPGGSPASVSTIPGLGALGGAATALGGFGGDIPGQAASFVTDPVTEQLLVTGAPRVSLRVSAVPLGPATATEAVLFAKVYDVAEDGSRTLLGGAVAPLRVTDLPSDGSPVSVTVALPGAVRAIEAGHRLAVAVSTTDQAYAVPAEPAAYVVAATSPLSVPIVPGRATGGSGVPVAPLVGIAIVLGAVAVLAVVARLRRRRADEMRADLADVPLVIDGLSKVYAGGFKAVDDLSFRVEPGQVLGLLGPNGAGKTTALRMLMGLIHPDGGEIRVFGRRVRPGSPVLSRLGAFVEGPGFLPHLSGMANLRLYWAATGRPTADAKLDEALEVAGLGAAVHRRVGTYSQGMRQRLAIAQAMLGLPDLLVLDEPTNGLDPPQIREMRDVLQRYAATGRTVLVSSHLLAEVEQTCTHVVVMHRGKLVANGLVADIVAGGGQATFRLGSPADAAAAVAALRALDGVADVESDGDLVHADLGALPRSTAVAALVRAEVAVEQAGPRRRLEDAFLQLVGEEATR